MPVFFCDCIVNECILLASYRVQLTNAFTSYYAKLHLFIIWFYWASAYLDAHLTLLNSVRHCTHLMKKSVNNPVVTHSSEGQHYRLESYKRTSEVKINSTIFKSYEYKTNEKLTIFICSFFFMYPVYLPSMNVL